ncbi:uncharacterized protein LOC103524116 [Trichonephila clavipes]|nr:uncharacterized protein LOC103524116 [Trichonephila clavipes]
MTAVYFLHHENPSSSQPWVQKASDKPTTPSSRHKERMTNCATYLGISLDCRITWTKKIAKVVENATSRLSLLKRIAGFKWGSSQSVLTSTFTSYIRPVIDYGSELLVTASDSALSKLDVVQNKALRFITGAATSTLSFLCN